MSLTDGRIGWQHIECGLLRALRHRLKDVPPGSRTGAD